MSVRLKQVLDGMGPVAVAVSGGVDSLTLMTFAHGLVDEVEAYHALSAAVPPAATERVRAMAVRFGWNLVVIDAGETTDPAYLKNPVDRCKVCKSHLYDAVAAATKKPVVSGTNVDDLGDYRPGLEAAKERGVRHPFVEAGLTKGDVRALARSLGLDDVAELPAQPCLSSRIETGIHIQPSLLTLVNRVEDAVRHKVGHKATVRCRVKKEGVVVELDEALLVALDHNARAGILSAVKDIGGVDAALAPYKMGSAFLRVV